MSKILFPALAFLFCIHSSAQNLVPNPSFEDTADCASKWYIDVAPPWFNPNQASSDHFSYDWCQYLPEYQTPRTGNAYAGIYTYESVGICVRDYIEVELSESLKVGKKYHVEFFVSRRETDAWAIDRIGAHFSADSIYDYNDPCILNYIPQVENPLDSILYDTSGWMKISGEFIAQGGEKFITIGNFRLSDSTMADSVGGWPNEYSSYYFIDDVSVVLDTGVSVPFIDMDNKVKIYPNPSASGIFHIKTTEKTKSIVLHSLTGQQFEPKSHSRSGFEIIDISKFPYGIYYIAIRMENHTIRKKLIYSKP